MKKNQQNERLLTYIRTVFCLSFALLFLTETFIPFVQFQDHDPIELTENAEEGEEKKEKEKEKEVFNSDQIFAQTIPNESLLSGRLISGFAHLDFIPDSVREIDTPPPEVI